MDSGAPETGVPPRTLVVEATNKLSSTETILSSPSPEPTLTKSPSHKPISTKSILSSPVPESNLTKSPSIPSISKPATMNNNPDSGNGSDSDSIHIQHSPTFRQAFNMPIPNDVNGYYSNAWNENPGQQIGGRPAPNGNGSNNNYPGYMRSIPAQRRSATVNPFINSGRSISGSDIGSMNQHCNSVVHQFANNGIIDHHHSHDGLPHIQYGLGMAIRSDSPSHGYGVMERNFGASPLQNPSNRERQTSSGHCYVEDLHMDDDQPSFSILPPSSSGCGEHGSPIQNNGFTISGQLSARPRSPSLNAGSSTHARAAPRPYSVGPSGLQTMDPYVSSQASTTNSTALPALKKSDKGARVPRGKANDDGPKVSGRYVVPANPNARRSRKRSAEDHADSGEEDDNLLFLEEEEEELGDSRPQTIPRAPVEEHRDSRNSCAREHYTVDDFFFADGPSNRPFQHDPEDYHHNHGANLAPSRYSGTTMPWGVNNMPEAVPQEQVKDASLLKRNIKRGTGKNVVKRGYGASDPENMAIVNYKDIDNLSFTDIAEKLNKERVANGRDPSLTTTGVNGRYNRTAPVLYKAQGKTFIPPSKRRKCKENVAATSDDDEPETVIAWNPDLDLDLVQAAKDYDKGKWKAVAEMIFERKQIKASAEQCAVRYACL